MAWILPKQTQETWAFFRPLPLTGYVARKQGFAIGKVFSEAFIVDSVWDFPFAVSIVFRIAASKNHGGNTNPKNQNVFFPQWENFYFPRERTSNAGGHRAQQGPEIPKAAINCDGPACSALLRQSLAALVRYAYQVEISRNLQNIRMHNTSYQVSKF